MNTRERILSALNHQPPDRIAWIPRLELWYNARMKTHTLPARWAGASQRQIEKTLNLGTPARDGQVYEIRYDGVEVLTHVEGNQSITEYITPFGKLRQVVIATQELVDQGITGLTKEHLLKTRQDYLAWEWIVERMQVVPTYDKFLAYDQAIGADGLPMVAINFSPLWTFLEVLVGFDQAYYHLFDYRDAVEHLFELMTDVYRQRVWPVVANSPAQLILTDAHLSSQLTPPHLFNRYLLPYHQELSALLHNHNKYLVMHGDADTSRILDLIETAGWDMVECFVTAPMTPVTMEQARQAWGDRVVIWGGIPSVLLSPETSEETFRDYVRNLFHVVAPGSAFILGVADNVMPDSLIERVEWVSEFVDQKGSYPLTFTP